MGQDKILSEEAEGTVTPGRFPFQVISLTPTFTDGADLKICPEFAPNVSQNKITGAAVLSFMSCFGRQCAKWDFCQGPNSPGALKKSKDSMVKRMLAGLVDACDAIPFGQGKAMKEVLSGLQSSFNV